MKKVGFMMKEETKKNIKKTFKDTCEDLLLIAVCFAIATSINKGCSKMSEHFLVRKSASSVNTKDSSINRMNFNQQKTR